MLVDQLSELLALIRSQASRVDLALSPLRDTSLSAASLYILSFLLILLLIDYARMLRLHFKMPPGPLPLPLIGNTHLLPDVKPWLYFESLSLKYNSPIITFWTGRRPTIWLNTASVASALLDKRANIYSSRPRMVVFAELGAGQSNLVNMYYGPRWRVHRKLTHAGVGLHMVRSYRDLQNDESKVVAFDLLSDPGNFVGHFERYAASVVSVIGFGRRVQSYDDPVVKEVIAVMQRAAELNVPGKKFPMLIESFPWLAKFPTSIAPWKHGLGGSNGGKGRGRPFFYALAEEAAQRPIIGQQNLTPDSNSNHTPDSDPDSSSPSPPTPPSIQGVRIGVAEETYAHKLFSARHQYNLSNLEISSLAGNLFGAGSDTSSSTLITFVLAAVAFPETLIPAWTELDSVVGPSRSPHFNDEANLPYVKAFVKEVFRWRSVAVLGGQPHANGGDDVYDGYFIPAHTWIQGNIWAIHHNPSDFPSPDRFNPARFLPNHPDSRPFPNEKGYMTFGWGRRICSGQGLAEQGTFISVARMLWGFRFEKALDERGEEVEVDIFDYTNGLNMRPNPFRCRITPRSDEIRATIEREGRQALKDLERYNGETKYRMSTYYTEEKL